MNLRIDGREIFANPGESLKDLVNRLGVDTKIFSQRPIAAKLAGEIFNLNYIPARCAEENTEPSSVRRAVKASGGNVHLISYNDPAGRDVYNRTAQFVQQGSRYRFATKRACW